MSVLTTIPKFLYPTSRQFPFDELAEKIVRSIEKRNWNVPGIKIEFRTYGSGEAKYQIIESITGDNFKLTFGRSQGEIDTMWSNSAALYSICIPKQMLSVYSDESGPVYHLYVGQNWETDKIWFMNSIKVNSKKNNMPRLYLMYSGKGYGSRAKFLYPNNDFDREYSPMGDEPISIDLDQKFKEFTAWLEENVLQYILQFEEASIIESPYQPEELIPYDGPLKTVYSFCDKWEAQRIKQGMNDPAQLAPELRHADLGSRQQLVPSYIPCNNRFPEVAYEGFIWCDSNVKHRRITKTSILTEEVIHAMCITNWDTYYIVAINLKYLNKVYVADNFEFEKVRSKLFKNIWPQRKHLTDEEKELAYSARGATIVPIAEYTGGYKEPIVLINRELEFSEIEKILD